MKDRLLFKIITLYIRTRKAEMKAKEYEERYNKLCRKYWKLYDDIDDIKGDVTWLKYLEKHSKRPED